VPLLTLMIKKVKARTNVINIEKRIDSKSIICLVTWRIKNRKKNEVNNGKANKYNRVHQEVVDNEVTPYYRVKNSAEMGVGI
jgi:hypothetical protein